MHPVFSRNGRLDLYLAAWLPVAVLLAGLLRATQLRSWVEAAGLAVPLAVNAAFLSLAMWPLCRAMPLRASRAANLVLTHAIAALVTCSVWLLLGSGWAGVLEFVMRMPDAFARYRADVPALFFIGTLVFVLATVVNYLLLAFESAREAERAALEMQVHARESELRALRAQINPHFLFNSLNAIGALAGTDAARARKMCVLLSDFFRRTMSRGAQRELTLAEELELVDAYLAIEQERFGNRLQVTRDIEPAALDCLVPALLLQPLVENAVTHGIANAVEDGNLSIAARERGGRLEITVANSFDPDAPRRAGHGLGLDNVRTRLATHHPGAARAVVSEEGERYVVTIQMPAVRGVSDAVEALQAQASAPPSLPVEARG